MAESIEVQGRSVELKRGADALPFVMVCAPSPAAAEWFTAEELRELAAVLDLVAAHRGTGLTVKS